MTTFCAMLVSALVLTTVPNGECILVNGALGSGEWVESGIIELDSETELRFHKNNDNLFMVIVFHGARHTGVDLYIQSGEMTHMLHVSAALGEKVLMKNDWSDFVWGQNSWWTANQIGSIYEEGRQRYLEPEAFEFQIDRKELKAMVRLFVHLKRPEKMLPYGATIEERHKWIQLNME